MIWRNRPFTERNCLTCGKTFRAFNDQVNAGKGKTCSRGCASARAAINRINQSGANNPNWRGGVATPNYAQAKRDYARRKPLIYGAHRQLQFAIRRGLLKPQPCEVCGERRVVGHHTNYERPLQVFWLCHYHHREEHKHIVRNGTGKYYCFAPSPE